MKKSILPVLFLLIITNLNGQTILDIKSEVFENYNLKYGIPRKITENETDVNEFNKIFEFSDKLDTIQETRITNGEISAQLMFVFNDNHQLIFRTFKNKVPLAGWQYKQSIYSYDKNGLTEIKTTSLSGKLLNLTKVKCDSLSNPTRLELYDSKLRLIGFETGDYNYENNKWIYRVFRYDGSLSREEEFYIEGVMPEGTKYNEQGDFIFYPRRWDDEDDTYYQIKYKYDKLGNWTKTKYYTIQKIDGKLKNRDKKFIYKRQIEYQN